MEVWPDAIVPGQDLGISLQALKHMAGQLHSSVLRETIKNCCACVGDISLGVRTPSTNHLNP